MARVLCAWEFGGDLGHIRRLIPIASELRAMGHEITVAFRDSAYLETARAEGFETFIAPLLRTPTRVNPAPLNFSEILANLGFDDRRGLAGALRAWRSLFALVAPDVLVADYAPTALIAAREIGLRRVTIGSGFSTPILADPLPALRSWGITEPAVLRALDDRLVASVRAATGAKEADPSERARDLFEADAHIVCTFPEIDPLGPRGGVNYVGPQADGGGLDIAWNATTGSRVFAYVKPGSMRFDAVVSALSALDAEVIVAAPGFDPQRAQALGGARLRVLPGAVNLAGVLASANLCVSHAGAGLVARSLVAGVPMALLPLQLEQFLVARRMAALGAAAVVAPDEPAPDLREWLESILGREDLRAAAAEQARVHGTHSFAEATRRAAQRIEAVAARG